MAKRKAGEIKLAHGPFWVDKRTGPIIARKVRFRHYKPDELEIARRFVKEAFLVGTYYFDFYLMTEEAKRILEKYEEWDIARVIPWMHRIDIVVFKARVVYLVEVKERLRYSGIGELIGYRRLFRKQYPTKKHIALGYVCAVDSPTLHPVLRELGIRLWVV